MYNNDHLKEAPMTPAEKEMLTKSYEKFIEEFSDGLVKLEEDERLEEDMIDQGHVKITIKTMANGYVVTVGNTSNASPKDTYVFPGMKELFDWMKENMSPTLEKADFINKL